MAIPFFMLGRWFNAYGAVFQNALVHLASAIVGSLRGGLGLITILASAFFGAISGSNPAYCGCDWRHYGQAGRDLACVNPYLSLQLPLPGDSGRGHPTINPNDAVPMELSQA